MTGHPHFDAIIFDMDGLLADTEPVWEEAETEMLSGYNIEMESEVRMQLVGLRNDVFLTRLIEHYGIPASLDTLQEDLINRMLKLIPVKAKPMAGALEIIHYALEHGIPTAIASSSPGVIIEAVVTSQGWGDFIPIRRSAEYLPAGKPEPHVYLEAAKALGVEPQKCLALEDSPTGAKAAVAAGMTCYAVPDLSHTRIGAFAGVTDHLFDSLHQVLERLTQVT
jgi:mannitol-1-/sugar-/sorbitol-6-/2-deoxyglucose-6-phosphatase